MTDEQIKQNAEAYINKMPPLCDALYESVAKEAFIAGANSRDEEFKQWKESKCKLRLRLMQQIHELRNPWISVENRLPDIGQKVITITNKGKLLLVARTTQPPHKEEGGWRWEHYVGKVTHWMQIPQTKKGE